MTGTTYHILSPTVTIYGITHPVTRPWTITAVWYCCGEPWGIEVNGSGWPVNGGWVPIPIDEFEKIPKALI
jgi:hypothetical protein